MAAGLPFARRTDGRAWAPAGWVACGRCSPRVAPGDTGVRGPLPVRDHPGDGAAGGRRCGVPAGHGGQGPGPSACRLPPLVPRLALYGELRQHNGRFEDFPGAVGQVRARAGDAIVFGRSSARAGLHHALPGRPADVLPAYRAPQPGGFTFRNAPTTRPCSATGSGSGWCGGTPRRRGREWRPSQAAGLRMPRVKTVPSHRLRAGQGRGTGRAAGSRRGAVRPALIRPGARPHERRRHAAAWAEPAHAPEPGQPTSTPPIDFLPRRSTMNRPCSRSSAVGT